MLGPETPLRRIEDDEEVKSRASQFLGKREASAPVVQGGTARSKAYEMSNLSNMEGMPHVSPMIGSGQIAHIEGIILNVMILYEGTLG